MEIFNKQSKSETGMGGYWGDYDSNIGMSFSEGYVAEGEEMPIEPIHYWKTSTQYFIGIEGEGSVIVDGDEIILKRDQIIKLEPGQKYKMGRAISTPFRWLVIGTVKKKEDKVILN